MITSPKDERFASAVRAVRGGDEWSVSTWNERERHWQFCGQGDAAWADERLRYLELNGYTARKRRV